MTARDRTAAQVDAGTTLGIASLLLPVLGEAPRALWEAARGGQPVVLTRDGAPALVVLDLDSYREAELAAEEAQ
jgi:prevent-host-death family protein